MVLGQVAVLGENGDWSGNTVFSWVENLLYHVAVHIHAAGEAVSEA